MSEEERIALGGLRLDWSGDRTERLLAGVQHRLVRRRRWRAVIASAAVAGGVGAAAMMVLRHPGEPAPNTTAVRPGLVDGQRVVRLAEGSEIRLDPTTSDVRVIEEDATRVRVDLVRGSSRYAVVPRAARTFEVRAGVVTVTVVGTEFVVERRGDAAWVEVNRGKVRVAWGDGAEARALLTAGQRGLYPPVASGVGPGAAVPAVLPALPPARRQSVGARPGNDHGPPATQSYRSQVARRDYRAAYAALARDPALAGDSVDELLLAADVARLSDHPSEAVPYLQRILREHARDERAPLAAFTLGRTLSGLGRTRQAMEMFARVHLTWPHAPLAEDALVREAEAAAALGDSARAARLAEQYDREHPGGARRVEVRRHAQRPPPVAPVAPVN